MRQRLINGDAVSYFDVRIPGLAMTVVQADGQWVRPVTVDEFRIAAGETYDVIVEAAEDRAYTVFAESMDRSGYARGPLPPRRARPLRSMKEMGMAGRHAMQEGGPPMDEMTGGADAHDMRAMDMLVLVCVL